MKRLLIALLMMAVPALAVNPTSLLHMEGDNGTTSFPDSWGNTYWAAAASAQVSTLDYEFGSASLLLNGSSDFLYIPYSEAFDFAASNFTIDCWFKLASTTSVVGRLWCIGDLQSNGRYLFSLGVGTVWGGGTKLSLSYSTGSGTGLGEFLSSAITPGTTWHHAAVVRNADVVYVYYDGVSITSGTMDWTWANNNDNLIGVRQTGANMSAVGEYFPGNIDEFRVVTGTAMWLENFTPPVAAYDDPATATPTPVYSPTITMTVTSSPTVCALDTSSSLKPPTGITILPYSPYLQDDAFTRQAADDDNTYLGGKYKYICPDSGWPDGRDAQGHLVPSEAFPDNGALAADIHGKGLKFGLYLSGGTNMCTQTGTGSYGYEYSDISGCAADGCDYIKMDWCDSRCGPQQEAETFHNAICATGRPMLLELCQWGTGDPWGWAQPYSNFFFVGGDLTDTWDGLYGAWATCYAHRTASYGGSWVYSQVLPIGIGGCTDAQYRAKYSLDCMINSPLFFDTNVAISELSAYNIATLNNPEVFAVNQNIDFSPASVTDYDYEDGSLYVVKPQHDNYIVALVNTRTAATDITVPWSALGGYSGWAKVRDLWAGADLGDYQDGITLNVAGVSVTTCPVTLLSVTKETYSTFGNTDGGTNTVVEGLLLTSSRFYLPHVATVSTIDLFVIWPSTNASAILGIYTDGSGGTVPGDLICDAPESVGIIPGCLTVTLTPPCHLEAGWYWLAFQANRSDFSVGYMPGGTSRTKYYAYDSTLPDPWPSGGSANTKDFDIYASYCEDIDTPTVTPTSSPTPTDSPTPTASPTGTQTNTPVFSPTPTVTPTYTVTPYAASNWPIPEDDHHLDLWREIR